MYTFCFASFAGSWEYSTHILSKLKEIVETFHSIG